MQTQTVFFIITNVDNIIKHTELLQRWQLSITLLQITMGKIQKSSKNIQRNAYITPKLIRHCIMQIEFNNTVDCKLYRLGIVIFKGTLIISFSNIKFKIHCTYAFTLKRIQKVSPHFTIISRGPRLITHAHITGRVLFEENRRVTTVCLN